MIKYLTILYLDTLCDSVFTVFTTFYSLPLRTKQVFTAWQHTCLVNIPEWSRISQTHKDVMVYFCVTCCHTEIIIHPTQFNPVRLD